MSQSTGWGEYRAVWRSRPWVLLIGIAAVALIVVSVVATVARGPLALLFIPGLALLYLQHLVVQRARTR